MKILWIANFNTAGVPFQIIDAINKFTKHNARLVQIGKTYLDYEYDILLSDISIDILKDMIHDADIIHINVIGPFFKFAGCINLLEEFTEDQKVFVYRRGSFFRQHYEKGLELSTKHHIHELIATPDLIKLCEEKEVNFEFLPQAVNLDSEPLLEFNPPKTRKISHSPTNMVIKSTDFFLRIMKLFPDIFIELIKGKPWKECLSIRRRCGMHYDQFLLGAYGTSAIEAMAIGQLCIVGLSDHSLEYYGDMPFIFNIDSEGNNLAEQVKRAYEVLIGDENYYLKILKDARNYVERVHSRQVIIKRLIKFYAEGEYFKS